MTLRYRMESRSTSEVRTQGAVENPQAAPQVETSTRMVVRLEVLAPDSAVPAAAGRVRLRVTYEKAAAAHRSDTFDRSAQELEELYSKLEGRSVELTLDERGRVLEVRGLQKIVAEPSAAAALRESLAQLTGAGAGAQRDVAIGQEWSTEQALPASPLAGLFSRTTSTYLRNEPCVAAGDAGGEAPPVDPAAMCAVIRTRFQILRRGGAGDPTPEDYRKRGLRTAGKFTGSGESLARVSLDTGWVVSFSQQGSEEMDLRITAVQAARHVRYAGRVSSQASITLLPEGRK